MSGASERASSPELTSRILEVLDRCGLVAHCAVAFLYVGRRNCEKVKTRGSKTAVMLQSTTFGQKPNPIFSFLFLPSFSSAFLHFHPLSSTSSTLLHFPCKALSSFSPPSTRTREAKAGVMLSGRDKSDLRFRHPSYQPS